MIVSLSINVGQAAAALLTAFYKLVQAKSKQFNYASALYLHQLAMSQNEKLHLIWIDLEMTGLDPDTDQIIEIATLITDSELNELAIGPEFAIQTPLAKLEAMDDWNRTHHAASGLWQRALASTVTLAAAEAATIAFLRNWVAPGVSPICGNSIGQDRRFLARGMPELERYFHYRNLDVSTIKELAKRWAPNVAAGVVKQGAHLALSDIRESVAELRYYRKFMGVLGGVNS